MSKDQVKFRGKLPYGYCENDEGKIIRDRFEVKVYSRIVSMYLKGKSMRQIAAALENDKIPTRLMKGEWSPGVISQILGHRAYYKGEIEMRSKKAEAGIIIFKCKPIITKERWYKIQDRIDKKRRGSDRSGSNADEFLLHKRLKCGVCGNTLSTRYQNEKGFYYCRWNRCSNAELESHNKSERCTLQPIRASEIDQHVYGLLIAYICGEAYGIGFISAKRIERSLDTKSIKPVGQYSTTTNWNVHHVEWDNNVFDPCIELNENAERVPQDENINDPYKNDRNDERGDYI